MGVQDVSSGTDAKVQRRFMQQLLGDLRAMEQMLESGRFETGVCRAGAEQELVLIDKDKQPAAVADRVLETIEDPRVTTEIGNFNLEYNLDPMPLTGSVLRDLEGQLHELFGVVSEAGAAQGVRPLLTGILPTLGLEHLDRSFMSPKPRYRALDEAITAQRGGHYQLRVKGIDELQVLHDTVMLEALNTSYQLHFQVDPDSFARAYNVAQYVCAPLLASSCNSPILFGKRLWRETRIAIFQQAVDTRPHRSHERDQLARVRFGEGWVRDGVMELYRADVARFRVLVSPDEEQDPQAELAAGRAPKLRALQAFNSTVYRWNRACYGITNGKPHLRIENRVLPAGPSIVDEVANSAFWFGLMAGGMRHWPDLHETLDFDHARSNFMTAARQGLNAEFHCPEGKVYSARELVLDHLLPVAEEGLASLGVDADDSGRYLAVVEDRVKTKQTGSEWMLNSVGAMKGRGTRGERLSCLTTAIATRQAQNAPVHAWPLASLDELEGLHESFARVGQYMSTDLLTVQEEDLVDFAASIMDWEHIRHIPVEDGEHRLVGLVSYRKLIRLLADPSHNSPELAVSQVMQRDPLSVTPETPTLEAIGLLRKEGISCLPVCKNGVLVGIVTEHDFMKVAGELLERHLKGELPSGDA